MLIHTEKNSALYIPIVMKMNLKQFRAEQKKCFFKTSWGKNT